MTAEMPDSMPVRIAQDDDGTLLFFFITEKGRDAYAAAPDKNMAVLEVGTFEDVPDAPYWARVLDAAPLDDARGGAK